MKYGFTLPGRGQIATPERLGIIAKKGEEFGFDALLTGDHILVPRNISSPYPYTEGVSSQDRIPANLWSRSLYFHT
ncbi:MAG: hypothetical protein Ct9H300mP11_12930 [Chloroflexota bacterium]|nr:MAG: hypothetical protein Ct9H300mP11_12930 [Chloroflexota bacterium]